MAQRRLYSACKSGDLKKKIQQLMHKKKLVMLTRTSTNISTSKPTLAVGGGPVSPPHIWHLLQTEHTIITSTNIKKLKGYLKHNT